MQRLIENALTDLKAVDPVVLDVRERTSITDLMVVASGNSTRHVMSIADEVIEQAKRAGVQPLGVEGQESGEWILVDLGDAVVHVMLQKVREHYRLESLWGLDDEAPLLTGSR